MSYQDQKTVNTQPATSSCAAINAMNENQTSNARLIAAAPDLLAAAKAVVAQWDTPNWKLTQRTGDLIAELRAAIAKAEGGAA